MDSFTVLVGQKVVDSFTVWFLGSEGVDSFAVSCLGQNVEFDCTGSGA